VAYSAAALITESMYLSGIVARDLETPNGSQLRDGLRLLNMLLTEKSISARLIPYYARIDVPTVAAQESYFIENLVNLEELTLTFENVRYSLQYLTRDQYFGSSRAENISTLPVFYTYEREKGGTRIYLYFPPDRVYELNVMGKFSLSTVGYDDDLTLAFDQFYIDYLTYALAERICGSYNVTFTSENNEALKDYENALKGISPVDLIISKKSTLQRKVGLNWGDINIGRTWRP
jgi:hypothetical protein